MDNLFKLGEESKDRIRDLKFQLYDRYGNLHSHFMAYLYVIVIIQKSNDLQMKHFVRPLIGLALMWYAEKDTSKWVSWDNLASYFIGWSNHWRKSKFIVEALRYDKVGLVEPQFRDKEKITINEESKLQRPK